MATAVTAAVTSCRDTARDTIMSAQACLTAWKEPIARPNWLRTLTYDTVASSIACARPRLSQAIATAPRSRNADTTRVASPSSTPVTASPSAETVCQLPGFIHHGLR